ncbi:MAG: DUF4956 domain-containing protein [Saprospiraceae bacterium]
MFDIGLTNFNPQSPSFFVMLITALFSFFLSSLIAVTYKLTTKSIYRKNHFLQSLILIGIVAATILQAIGESVAIGLGIIGALSIIRFRTSFIDPRNITFIFASLGSGVACGVMGYGIALTGTMVFCLGANILRFSPMSNNHELIGELKLRVPMGEEIQDIIEQKLKKHCRHFDLERLRSVISKKSNELQEGDKTPIIANSDKEKILEFVYLISLKDSTTLTALEGNLSNIDGLENLRLEFQNRTTKL